MHIAVEPEIRRLHTDFLQRLEAVLAPETFESACAVDSWPADSVCIHCLGSPGGIVAETWQVEAWYFEWIRAELKHSVLARDKGLRPAA